MAPMALVLYINVTCIATVSWKMYALLRERQCRQAQSVDGSTGTLYTVAKE